MLEVAEGRHDTTGVGVHGRPHAAAAVQARPLPAEHRALLEDRRLEALREQPPRGDQPTRPGADHGDASRHRGTFARLQARCADSRFLPGPIAMCEPRRTRPPRDVWAPETVLKTVPIAIQ